jgi:hypothetical protein
MEWHQRGGNTARAGPGPAPDKSVARGRARRHDSRVRIGGCRGWRPRCRCSWPRLWRRVTQVGGIRTPGRWSVGSRAPPCRRWPTPWTDRQWRPRWPTSSSPFFGCPRPRRRATKVGRAVYRCAGSTAAYGRRCAGRRTLSTARLSSRCGTAPCARHPGPASRCGSTATCSAATSWCATGSWWPPSTSRPAPGNPAPDLAAAWWTFEGEARRLFVRMLTEAGATEDDWARAAGWVIAPALAGVGYYAESRPDLSHRGRQHLEAVLTDPGPGAA